MTDANAPITASLLLKLEARDTLNDEERAILGAMFTDVRLVGAGNDIVREGDRPMGSAAPDLKNKS